MITTILLFIIILGIIIFVHELGHFFVAKRMGVGVEEFGFGYPPRIIGIQKSNDTSSAKKWQIISIKKKDDKNPNTIYSINWIPFGGFVKIKGEQGNNKNDRDSFANKKIWQRAIVLSAGVTMNVVLAFVIISIGFNLGLPSIIDGNLPAKATIEDKFLQIAQVEPDSPAAKANLEIGDFIITVDGHNYTTTKEFQSYVEPNLDKQIILIIKRSGQKIEKTVIPEDLYDNGKGLVGAWLVETGIVKYPWYYSIWMGMKTTVIIVGQILIAFYELIKNLLISQQVSADIAGPVGIAVLTGQVAKLGFIYILQFTALLSINLAIINFIPFPALDGGRVLFLIIEKIKGSPVNQKIEGLIHNIGFLVLITFILFVTFKDISRFSDNIKGFFSNLL